MSPEFPSNCFHIPDSSLKPCNLDISWNNPMCGKWFCFISWVTVKGLFSGSFHFPKENHTHACAYEHATRGDMRAPVIFFLPQPLYFQTKIILRQREDASSFGLEIKMITPVRTILGFLFTSVRMKASIEQCVNRPPSVPSPGFRIRNGRDRYNQRSVQ